MGQNSKIQWTHHTFNPWRGCTKVSPGCANCYAETMSRRNPAVLGVWGDKGIRVVAAESKWREPLKWDREAKAAGERRRVFCASLADVFEDREELIAPRIRLFRLMRATPNLDWLLLTKRPESVRKVIRDCLDAWPVGLNGSRRDADYWYVVNWLQGGEPSGEIPDNVWLGVSAENQEQWDRRVPILRGIPAKIRFVSQEPMLGPIRYTSEVLIPADGDHPNMVGYMLGSDDGQSNLSVTRAEAMAGIHWVILGGESGPNARPCNVEWIRDGVKQCREAGVAVFVKQLGASITVRNDSGMEWPNHGDEWIDKDPDYMPRYQGEEMHIRLRDPKGGDLFEWPDDLRVREVPR